MHTRITSDIALLDEPLLQSPGDSDDTYIVHMMNRTENTFNADNTDFLETLCIAARELCEKEIEMSFGQKTIVAYYHSDDVEYRERVLELPLGPISSISEVLSISQDGTETTLASGTGYYSRGDQYKKIEIPQVFTTAVGTNDGNDDIKITYIAGFGASGCEALPEALRQAMAKQVLEWYHNRVNWVPVLHSEVKEILWNWRNNVI